MKGCSLPSVSPTAMSVGTSELCLFTLCFVPGLHLEDFHTRLEFREEEAEALKPIRLKHVASSESTCRFTNGPGNAQNSPEALKPIRLKHVALLTRNYPILWLFQHRCSWCSCCMCQS